MGTPRRLGQTLTTIAGKALGKRGAAYATLLAQWPDIAGPEVCGMATPLKLAFPAGKQQDAVLYVEVSGAAALLLQHQEREIITRVNAFMGWGAVARLKFVQGMRTVIRPQPTAPPAPLPAHKRQALIAMTMTIDDPGLRDSLLRFGQALAERESFPV
jgi:hypothetical protein